MSRNLKILFRVVSILLLLLIITVIAGVILIHNPKFQTKLVHYYTTKLSDQLGTKVEVGDVDVKFFTAVTLNKIYVEDLNGDTLFYAGKVHSDAVLFQPFSGNFVLNNSQMDDVKIRIRRGQTDSLTNLDQLFASNNQTRNSKKAPREKKPLNLVFRDITMNNFDLLVRDSLAHKDTDFRTEQLTIDFEAFKLGEKIIEANYLRTTKPYISLITTQQTDREEKDTTSFSLPKGWTFGVSELTVNDGEFVNRGSPKTPGKEDAFAFNSFHWKDLQVDARNISGINDELEINIDQLSFTDETGFSIDDMQTRLVINPDDISLKDLNAQLDQSTLVGDINLNYRQFRNFKEFEDLIRLDVDMNQVKLMPKEFRLLFGSNILKEPITLSGQLQGKLSNLSTQNLTVRYRNGAVIRGDIDARGLPDLESTFIDAKIDQLSFTQAGLQQIMGRKPVPEQVKKFGDIAFEGEFLGYLTDLIAYGYLNTDIGNFDLDVKYTDANGLPSYSGYVQTSDFQLGYWLDNSDLGVIDVSGSIAGTNFDLANMSAQADVKINSIDFKGNEINNFDLNGQLNNQVLQAIANVNDEVFVGVIDGSLDFSQPTALIKLDADVQKGDLYALGVVENPLSVSGNFTANLIGNSIAELQGTVSAENSVVVSKEKKFDLGNLGLELAMLNGEQVVSLASDNASVKFTGNYNYTQLVPTVLKTVNEYYDFNQGWEDLENTVERDQEIGFELEIDPKDQLIQLVLPELNIRSGVNASGLLNPATDEISILALADSLAYENYSITNWQLDAFGDGQVLYVNSFQDDIQNNGKRWLNDSELNVELSRDDILVDVRTYNEDFLSAKLASRIKRNGDEFNISILSSELILNGEEWRIQEDNSITLGGGTWKAENFSLRNGEQVVEIFNPTNQGNTKLVVNIEKINMAAINSLIGFTQKPFEGDMSGDISLVDYQGGLNLDVSLVITDLLYNNDVVEVTSLEGFYDLDGKVGEFEGIANDSEFQFVIDADLDLNKQEDILDMNIDIEKSSLSPFENLWASSLENVDGYVEGNIRIVGGPTLFTLSGGVDVIEDVLLTLSFTQARYKIAQGQTIDIQQDGFVLNQLIITDPFGQEALVNGKIRHNDLTNFTLDIDGSYENFLFLNTTTRDNEVFYGRAFATGNLRFSGPVDDALLEVDASSEPNTRIVIASPSAQNTSEYSFIRFRQPESDTLTVEDEETGQSLLTMDFDLDIDPNAEVNMNFDVEGFNSLRANGYGNLNVRVDTDGLLEIDGIYEVNQGAYVVNFRDIFEREFRILPGGIIQWATDPYNANLDISAQYVLEADVSALTSNTTNARFLADATTELNVNITGTLLEPAFNYNIEVDRAQVGSEINEQLRVINDDPTKLDNQIGSLLLLRQFSNINSDPFSSQRGGFGGLAVNSITNILTSQISSLLSESGILENTEIGIDYENYQDLVNSGQLDDLGLGQSVQLQLSSRWLNDRLEVEYGGDFNFGDGLDDNINAFEVGDFVLTYSLSDSGNYKFKLFSRRDFSIIQQQEKRRNGFGFVIERDFNNFKELFENEETPKQPTEELPPEQQPALEAKPLENEPSDSIPKKNPAIEPKENEVED